MIGQTMAGYNRVVIVGNLTRDPEHRQLPSGQAVCRLGLASNRQYKNRQSGSLVQEVCYVDVDVWGAQAESCRQYLKKGSPVLIEGRLKFDSWKDAEGQTRSKHSIVADRVIFLSSSTSEAATITNPEERLDDMTRLDPNNALEKDILGKLDTIKDKQQKQKLQAATKAKKTASEDAAGGTNSPANDGITFPDEQPFEELPF